MNNTSNRPLWSIIICSINAAKFAQVSRCYEQLLCDRPFEIIGIHDAASLCEGYNRGIAHARGDILVFSHDDILILDDAFASKTEERLNSGYQLLGFAGTTQLTDAYWWAAGPQYMRGAIAHAGADARKLLFFVYGVGDTAVESVQAIDGLCMIAHRSAIDKVKFDETTFDGFHLYDLDFSFSAYHAGLRVGVMTDVPIIHMSSGGFDGVWQTYRERFLNKHLAALGLSHDVEVPAPQVLKARAVEFQDIVALREAWQPIYLRRATIAMLRNAG